MELPGQATDDAEALEDGLKVKPVLLQKGDTKLALYGMGNIRDDRFVFELTNRRINLYRPAQDPDDWFNIILVHQNRWGFPSLSSSSLPLRRPLTLSLCCSRRQRCARSQQLGAGRGVWRGGQPGRVGPRARLHRAGAPAARHGPAVLHHTAWQQHRDESRQGRGDPEVRLSLSLSRRLSACVLRRLTLSAPRRHVGLLKIQGKEWEFEPIRLRSVRPFVFEEISLYEYHEDQKDDRKKLTSKVAVNKYLKSKVRGR